ncbi:MAG: aminodeoxychorismate synthase component I [Gemmatimonadales bacterium]
MPQPVLVEELIDAPSPSEACARLLDLPYPLLLESSARGSALSRCSYLTADPSHVWTSHPADERDVLREVAEFIASNRQEPIAGLPPFQGGVAGFLGYEFGRRLERLPVPRADDLALPDAWFGAYDWVISWDHEQGRAWVMAGQRGRGAAGPSATSRIEDIVQRLRAPATTVKASHNVSAPDVASGFTREEYLRAVERVRQYILAGDIFQANMSQRFSAPWTDEPFNFYRRLVAANPAPFSAYFQGDGFAVASASPERFLSVDTAGHVETRPIKGTRPRGATPAEDRRLADELLTSAKDRAENVMIVDLLRNDLSKVCRPGSVEVPALCALESHPTVHHLESIVTGRLEPERTAADLLRAAFPGGSITGAPKVRAMEILTELEPVARGVYCGTIGWLGLTGAMDSSIAIRTVTLQDGCAYFHAGGGIVADSDPAMEFQETLDKAAGIRRAFGTAA